MKVLHVIPSLSAADGGPTHALALMERALAGQGVNVETAATDDAGPGHRNGKLLGKPLPENGGVHWYFAKQLDFYKLSPGFARWIAREVERFDLLHLHALFSFTTTVAARAARRAGVPYVVRPMGSLDSYGMTHRRPGLKQLSLRFIESPVLLHAAAVHFTSEQEAAQARQLGIAMREAVIPLGVEMGARSVRTRPATSILFLSRLDPKKNVEALLDAIAQLRASLPQLQLVVAGDGEPGYVTRLHDRAQSLGLAGCIRWTGHVQGEAKAAVFEQADVFVLPSFSENFGIAAAEALAAGLPCVLGEGVAIASDVVQAGAGVAVTPDARAIARGLRLIIDDDATRAAMSAKAMRLAQERYSTGAMGSRLKQLYTDILNGPDGFP